MAAMNKKVSNKQKKDTLMFHLMLLIPVIMDIGEEVPVSLQQ